MNAIIILNPHAGSGRAVRQFRQIESLLPQLLGDFIVVVTSHPEEVAKHLHLAGEAGYDTIISVGGDGTNHAIIRALAEQPEHGFTFGTLPFGTGSDWARTLGIPHKPKAALQWLVKAEPCPVDLGRVTVDGKHHVFLNVASTGLSGEVARRVNAAPVKRPWTFLTTIIRTLLQFAPPGMRVFTDGKRFYEGDAFILSVGNGRFFARGMQICPDAYINDGLFDVVLVEGMGRAEVLSALPTTFRGTHIHRDDVHVHRARHVLVEALDPTLGMEMDGEGSEGKRMEFQIVPGAIRMLVDPSAEAVQ